MATPLDDDQRQELVEVLEAWAAVHPRPDESIMQMGSIELSPASLAEAVRDPDSDTGASVIRLFELDADERPLADSLARFRTDIDRWG